MKKYDSLIFDLDGTLWDACSSTAKGWTKAMSLVNQKKIVTREDIESICGLVYDEILEKLFSSIDIDRLELKKLLNDNEKSMVEKKGGILYEGVLEYIPLLSAKYKLFIVSNCQKWYLDAFLSHSKLNQYFQDWESHGNTGKSKCENIRAVILRNKIINPIYIGDTPGDLSAAEEANIDFFYARYGFQNFTYEPFSNSFTELFQFFDKN